MEETMKTTAAAESAAADPSQDIQPIEMPEGSYSPAVAVMCHPGTLDLMKRIWEERLQNTELIFIELDEPTEDLLNQLGHGFKTLDFYKDVAPG